MLEKKLSGFSLLEILISLMLLSMTLIGMDAMQIMTLRDNRAIYFFSVAENQMKSMRARLRVSKNQEEVNIQLQRWNEENKLVLPDGEGVITGNLPYLTLTLYWGEIIHTGCTDRLMGVSGCLVDTLAME